MGSTRSTRTSSDAIGAIAVGRSGESGGDGVGPAVPALGSTAEARWDLHGLLAGLTADAWDADPGGGEWTVRQTMGHILGGQLSYSWYNAWYLSHPVAVGLAERPPDSDFPPEPTEDELATGTPAEVAGRLDSIVDASIAAVAGLDPASMDIGARWAGLPVSIGFRLGRYGSHIREHTIQVDKTLAMLGREPTEVERLVRLILTTYGRLEAVLIGRNVTELDRPLGNRVSAIGSSRLCLPTPKRRRPASGRSQPASRALRLVELVRLVLEGLVGR